jgi:hypothetical protein
MSIDQDALFSPKGKVLDVDFEPFIKCPAHFTYRKWIMYNAKEFLSEMEKVFTACHFFVQMKHVLFLHVVMNITSLGKKILLNNLFLHLPIFQF